MKCHCMLVLSCSEKEWNVCALVKDGKLYSTVVRAYVYSNNLFESYICVRLIAEYKKPSQACD